MALPPTRRNNAGSFLQTTFNVDVARLHEVTVDSEEFKELLVRLYQNLTLMVDAINSKDTGYYATNQLVNGQLYFPNPSTGSSLSYGNPITYRQVRRVVINFGALPNTTSKSVAHGITVTPSTTFTRIYGTASDTTDELYIPLPYVSAQTDIYEDETVELKVNATNVTVITSSDRSAFTLCYIVLEFLNN